MDRKVSVSRFLQQARRAPGAKPPPPPPPRPSPPPSPADWRTMKRPTNGTIGFGALLLGIVILIVAVLPPRSQSPTTVPASTTPVREPNLAVGLPPVQPPQSPTPHAAVPRHYDVPQSQGPAAWHDTPPTPAPDRAPWGGASASAADDASALRTIELEAYRASCASLLANLMVATGNRKGATEALNWINECAKTAQARCDALPRTDGFCKGLREGF
jgi:hypothetical protein